MKIEIRKSTVLQLKYLINGEKHSSVAQYTIQDLYLPRGQFPSKLDKVLYQSTPSKLNSMVLHGLGIRVATHALRSKPARGSVVILHGTCDSGNGMRDWLKNIQKSEFAFPDFQVLYPSAPLLPYSLMNGQTVRIWYDRLSIGPDMPEDKLSMEQTALALGQLLTQESETSGIPLSKTVVGGFSTGGTMALHLGYRFQRQLAGVFALSTFLHPDSQDLDDYRSKCNELQYNENHGKASTLILDTDTSAGKSVTQSKTPGIDQVYNSIAENVDDGKTSQVKVPRLFMGQGYLDPLVKYPWARATFYALKSYGAEGQFHTLQDMKHDIDKRELSLLYDWIHVVLAESSPTNSSGTPPAPARPKTRNGNGNGTGTCYGGGWISHDYGGGDGSDFEP